MTIGVFVLSISASQSLTGRFYLAGPVRISSASCFYYTSLTVLSRLFMPCDEYKETVHLLIKEVSSEGFE